ncbi:hypothetical protein HBE96_07170 [Clostridium sp. P21]|uniref:Uncharacterized protein n=1 Tax=Clostridium muellerianum TaxID=2716538 RepID=A0A7Y0EFI3_9CLOT|nr:hypothetical protein [Clostridium muellerianum]NMM62473.1 hypothetical protein [Clostridium muellerianum]
MENCTNVLSTNNSINKNKTSNTTKKLNEKSFGNIFNRIITNKINNSTKSNLTAVSTSSIEDINEKLEAEMEQKADAAVERLAGFFGIGKTLMKAILKSMKISPTELLDPSRKKDIIKTLTKKFGLGKDRTEALTSLITDFQK